MKNTPSLPPTVQQSLPSHAARRQVLATEYLAPLAAAFGITLVLMWPLPTYFTRALIGVGDVTGSLGTLWTWQQIFLGHEPPYYASRLYYPHGINFFTNSIGPFSALFAMPFWGLGPAVAYNAAIVIGFALTGFCMYLLARAIGCSRPAAWVAGLLLMMMPLHILAVYGHVNKVFLGFLPLALLVTHRAFTPGRRRTWALLVGPLLVLAFLQSPEQLVFGGMGCLLLALYNVGAASRGQRREAVLRLLLILSSIGLCTAPLFFLVAVASGASGVAADVGLESARHQPDLLQFFIPSIQGVLPFRAELNAWTTPAILTPIETTVYLTWTALFLCTAALWTARRRAGAWLLILLAAMVLSLGPTLRVAGESAVTQQGWPLPYAFLNTLPGLNAMRTPGRFMLVGQVALAVLAAIGLDQLRERSRPALKRATVAVVAALILWETWMPPFVYQPMLPPPPFYTQIARDKEMYGVLDLPIRPSNEITYNAWHIYFSAFSQVDQITHGKGIATGYVARFYAMHPLFAHFISENFTTISPLQQDLTVNGKPSSRYENLRYYLAKNNYRYVVLHKPQAAHPVYKPGAWGEKAAQRLVHDVFGDQPPLVDDAVSTVYAVGPAPDVTTLKPAIALLEPANYQGYRPSARRVDSPGQFLVHSPGALVTHLDVMLRDLGPQHDYELLTLISGGGHILATAPIAPQETTRIPVALLPGSQVITLTVTTLGADAGLPLGFTIGQIDMATAPDPAQTVAVPDSTPQDLQATYGEGWDGLEADSDGTSTWRWAASPAALWVYSRDAQTVTLGATPVALHDSTHADGKGPTGTLLAALDGRPLGQWPVTVGLPFSITLALAPGWNSVTLQLAAGNFRPSDLDPSTGDSRLLSFALQDVTLAPAAPQP